MNSVQMELEDIFMDAECVKAKDYIFPWDDSMNPDGKVIYKVLRVDVKPATVEMRLQYKDSLLTWVYKTKVGCKERVHIPN